jgi:hypothetical protein
VEGAFADALAVAVDDSVAEVALIFLFLAAASSSEGKLIREKTLAFCLRSAAAAASARAALIVDFDTGSDDFLDVDFVTGSDDFLEVDLVTSSDDFLDVDLLTGSDDFLDEDSVR